MCNFVAMRLDGLGMRWGCDRAKLVLRLRGILLNEQFVCSLATRSIKLADRPAPTSRAWREISAVTTGGMTAIRDLHPIQLARRSTQSLDNHQLAALEEPRASR